MPSMNIGRTLAAFGLTAVTCLVPAASAAVTVSLTHPYRDLVDQGAIRANIFESGRLDCAAGTTLSREGNRFLAVGKRLPGEFVPGECTSLTADLGTLAAGHYELEARLQRPDGAAYDAVTVSFTVLPLEGRCNPDPTLSPSIMGAPASGTAAEFVTRVKTDPALASALGHPAVRLQDYQSFEDEVYFDYPPLDDIPPAMDRLARTGLFKTLWRNGRACFSAPPPDAVGTFVEFHHAGLDHYFYTGNAGEIADIDAGKVGAWTRTGRSFRAVVQPGCEASSPHTVVYRFNGIPGKGPSSHFFTRDRAECHAVDKSRQWSLEGIPFFAAAPGVDGTCPSGQAGATVALYRLWRPFGDSNHRFTTDPAIVAEMKAKGWVDEGTAMCVLPGA